MKLFSFGRTAAVSVAVVLLCLGMSACSMFRPIDGSEWESTTIPAETTSAVVSDETSDTAKPAVTDPPVTNPPVTEPPVTEPPKPKEKRVSILAAGDNIIHEAVYLDAAKRAADGAKYDFLPMYNGIAEEVAAADIAFINHETPIAGEGYAVSGYPTFNAPTEAGQALVEAGFDVINLSNNHILDKRVAGARATVSYVQGLPVTQLGVYLDEKDYANIRVTECNGIRIAWVAFTGETNNPYNPATADIILPMLNDDSAVQARIKAAKEISDFVVVSAHWGKDGAAAVTDEQRRMAKLMAEAGADVIIGHHPHILQSVEWVTASSGKKTLTAYSLGNLLSSQLYANNMIGGLLCFDVVMDENGACKVENAVMDIAVNHYSGKKDASQDYGVYRYGMQLYMLDDYTEALAKEHGCRFFSTDFSRSWIDKHVRSIISEEFLPACLE